MVIFIFFFALAGILLAIFMDWTFNDLLFIPTSLGIFCLYPFNCFRGQAIQEKSADMVDIASIFYALCASAAFLQNVRIRPSNGDDFIYSLHDAKKSEERSAG